MNHSKRKGTSWETEVCRFLQANGFPYAERRALSGNLDRGDVAGIPGWVLEAKNAEKICLGEWMKEAETEARNDNTNNYAVVIKRRMKPAGEAYAVVPLRLLAELIRSHNVISSRGDGVSAVAEDSPPTP